jgi:hypothetical protein
VQETGQHGAGAVTEVRVQLAAREPVAYPVRPVRRERALADTGGAPDGHHDGRGGAVRRQQGVQAGQFGPPPAEPGRGHG